MEIHQGAVQRWGPECLNVAMSGMCVLCVALRFVACTCAEQRPAGRPLIPLIAGLTHSLTQSLKLIGFHAVSTMWGAGATDWVR